MRRLKRIIAVIICYSVYMSISIADKLRDQDDFKGPQKQREVEKALKQGTDSNPTS